MTVAAFPEDIGDLLLSQGPPGGVLRYSQGTILTWNPNDFTGTVGWRGITLTNVPVLASVQALGFQPGDVVGMLGWAPQGGMGSWWIIGKLALPGVDSPDLVVRGSDLIVDGGTLIIEGGGNQVIRDGGNLTVAADGEIRSSNFNGDLSLNNPGNQGWAIGNELFAFNGTFIVAIDFDSGTDSNENFGVTTTETTYASVTFSVPSWAEQAMISASTSISLEVTTDSGLAETVRLHLYIDGISTSIGTPLISDGHLPLMVPFSRTVPVSASSTIVVDANLEASGSLASNVFNTILLSAQVTWKSEQ